MFLYHSNLFLEKILLTNRLFLKNTNRYNFLLILIVFLFAANNLIWLKNNTTAPVGNGLQDLWPGVNFYFNVINSNTPLKHIFLSAYPAKIFLYEIGQYIRHAFFIYPKKFQEKILKQEMYYRENHLVEF